MITRGGCLSLGFCSIFISLNPKKDLKFFSSKRANNLLKRFCSLISALRVPDYPSISGKMYSPFSGCISPPGPNPTLGTLLVILLFAFSVSGYFNAFVRLFGLNRPNNRFEKFAALLVKDMRFALGKYSILFYVYKIISQLGTLNKN